MIENIYQNTKIYMKKCIFFFKKNINKICINRVSLNLFENIKINCYNKFFFLNELSSIIIKNNNELIIKVFDKNNIKKIEKAILINYSDYNTNIIKNKIYISIPKLSEERRKNFVKIIRKELELSRIYIRNIRQKSNNEIKKLLKNKKINLDNKKYFKKKIQNLTDKSINKINLFFLIKEKELMLY